MKKVTFILVCVLSMAFSFLLKDHVIAASNVVTGQTERREAITRADEIEIIYRYIDGKVQYRRWNATRGYWVDDDWIDL